MMSHSMRPSTGLLKLGILAALLGCAPLAPALDEAPRNVQLVEKKLDQLSSNASSTLGQIALSIKPEKWRHAETDHFIFHYRRITEAQKVVHRIEYHLWFVANTLGASKEQYQRKSHVFIFEDEKEWQQFLSQTSYPQWFGSFAHGDELFLNVRQGAGNFDEHVLAHETTHAVVARLYPGQHWPVWLNEGFAEYMAGASEGARKGITAKYFQRNLALADIPVAQLTSMITYPSDRQAVASFYQSSERLVRFLMNEWPKEQFRPFAAEVVSGKDFQAAFKDVYGYGTQSFEDYSRKYDRFVR